MSRTTIVPERGDLFGHWYLFATAQGFLERYPRVDACEIYASAGVAEKVHFHTEFTVPRRRYRFQTSTAAPMPSGRFNWVGVRGLSIFTRDWTLSISEDRSVLAAYHRGSMIIQQGWVLFSRAEVDAAHAREVAVSGACMLGMSPREPRGLTFRERPVGMTPDGGSPFLTWATTEPRRVSPRLQVLPTLHG